MRCSGWLFAGVLWLGLIPSVWAQAHVPAPAPAPAASAPSEQQQVNATAPDLPDRFTVEVEAPPALRTFLLRHLELQRYRQLADLDLPELRRLVAEVPGDATALLATEGFLAPKVVAQFASEDSASSSQPRVLIRVEPGPQVRVDKVEIRFVGDIASRPESAAQRAAIRAAFQLRLQEGMGFTQARWDAAKTAALQALTDERYPSGRITQSRADIDAEQRDAALQIEFDSGAPLRLGDLQISGTQRYDPDWVRRMALLAGLTPGSEYRLDTVLEAQRRISASSYFSSAIVQIEPGTNPDHATVLIKVREVERSKLVLGIGGSTDEGLRLTAEHRNHRLPGLSWEAISSLTLAQRQRSLQSTLNSPIDAAGWHWQLSGSVERQTDASGTTTSQRLRAGQAQDNPEFSRSLFLQYDRARTVVADQPDAAQAAVSANYAWTLRRLQPPLFPDHGYALGMELGLGYTLAQVQEPYLRARVRGLTYLPLADSANGRIALRADLGAVAARDVSAVPSTELFLTGGDSTVRGYALHSLGVVQPDGTLDPGRLMSVGSVEWQRPIVLNGQRSQWENAYFIDAGGVSNQLATLRPKIGIGTGVRYRSPVGPLQLDLAYGVATKRLRLHLTVGFSF